jgi:hypothetical protein
LIILVVISNDEYYSILHAAGPADLKELQDIRDFCINKSISNVEKGIFIFDLRK